MKNIEPGRWSRIRLRQMFLKYYRPLAPLGIGLVLSVAMLACRPTAEQPKRTQGAPNAQPQLAQQMRDSMAADYHPSDGGGRAWLQTHNHVAQVARAGSAGSWTIVYEAGPLGVDSGGMIVLQVSPFWGWSTPQTQQPQRPGYTRLKASADDIALRPMTSDQQQLVIFVEGRGITAGETVTIEYGAVPGLAIADRYAERQSRFWIAVDGNGDGIRKVLENSPSIDVHAGPPAQLRLTLPSTRRPGETARLNIAVLDSRGNAGVEWAGDILLTNVGTTAELPERITLGPQDRGLQVIDLAVEEAGIYQVRAEIAERQIEAISNPLLVDVQGMPIWWGDLQIHSGISDGTGIPEDVLRYARDVAGLDFAAITDHDHWGMLTLDSHPRLWQMIDESVRNFHQPGSFISLLGFEWTNWIYGHRHVVYFGDSGEVLSSLDDRYDTPQELWDALRGLQALTFAHHSAGRPVATDWSIPPDPELEPVTEIVSIHGSSEAADSPRVLRGAIPGNFVRDQLDRGYRLGMIGSSDGHDGHPGLSQIDSGISGLAAVLSERLSRADLYQAMRARRVYATSGARILLRTSLGGHRMGEAIKAEILDSNSKLVVFALAPQPITRVDIIRSGNLIRHEPDEISNIQTLSTTIADLSAGEYLYVRIIQSDGHFAASSPFFIE